jgi:hypothetical protein
MHLFPVTDNVAFVERWAASARKPGYSTGFGTLVPAIATNATLSGIGDAHATGPGDHDRGSGPVNSVAVSGQAMRTPAHPPARPLHPHRPLYFLK